MRLANINGKELRVSFEPFVCFSKVTYLGAEGRSGIAPEYKHERPRADLVAQMQPAGAVRRDQFDVGSFVADFHFTLAHPRQSVTQHAVRISRTSHPVAEPRERETHQRHDG